MSEVEQIEHFTGVGLYDKSFINVLRDLNDRTPFLRGIVAEFRLKHKYIPNGVYDCKLIIFNIEKR
ncbi:hypothetical protein [Clostridium thailandense]|uniref:hypothetical protein n=1 Tax=Clostridium thailandense TaxID=2794346 RepID=UPI00406BD799